MDLCVSPSDTQFAHDPFRSFQHNSEAASLRPGETSYDHYRRQGLAYTTSAGGKFKRGNRNSAQQQREEEAVPGLCGCRGLNLPDNFSRGATLDLGDSEAGRAWLLILLCRFSVVMSGSWFLADGDACPMCSGRHRRGGLAACRQASHSSPSPATVTAHPSGARGSGRGQGTACPEIRMQPPESEACRR